MKRTYILLIAVLILGGIIYFASGSSFQSTTLQATDERDFALPEIDELDRIFIADRKGHTVNLTRGGETGWLADGKEANENVMKNLLAVIERLEVQSLPTHKAVPNMVKSLATQGILVQLFDRDNQKIKGYYIGGSNNSETGTYAIMEGSDNPYVVHLPGFTGNVRTRISLWDDEWRSKVYFQVDPDKVERLSIEYPNYKSKSFSLVKRSDDYYLHSMAPIDLPEKKVSRGVAEGILSRYEKYYINRYENLDNPSKEKARSTLPFAIIKVKQKGKEEKTMKVYPRYGDGNYRQDPKTGETFGDTDLRAYTAFINNDADWVLLNVETTQPLLVGYDSF